VTLEAWLNSRLIIQHEASPQEIADLVNLVHTDNAVNPLISIFGLMLPGMVTSMVLLGKVLGYESFGAFMIGALQWQRQHTLIACLLVYASFLLAGNLIADLLLIVTDPRIRY
jgi:peptide/nickel transport system permease protein